MSKIQEFYEVYNTPYIGDTIVGFSGIDPAPKTAIPASYYGNNGASPDTTHDNHELLEGLLGGSNGEHYHFTLAEYRELQDVLIERRDAEQSTEERYTLDEEEHEKLREIIDAVYPNGADNPVFVDAETLNTLVTASVQEYLTTNPPEGEIATDTLNSLVDTRIQAYLRTNTPEAEINTDTLEELIQEYLTTNPPEGTINTEAIDARIAAYMTAHPIEQPTIDTEALNTAIDERIEQYLEENPPEPASVEVETINTLIDTRIQQYLQNLNGGEVIETDSDNP